MHIKNSHFKVCVDKGSNTGFTIIEVLIALSIFSIGMLAMSALQNSSLMASGNIATRTEAWTILDDQVERLKSMPFYANNNGVDDDGDGTIDEIDEEISRLTAGTYDRLAPDGRHTVHWQVVDDPPLSTALSNMIPIPIVSSGNYVVSKTISVHVTLGNNQKTIPTIPTNSMAMVSFIKTWAGSGQIPYK